MAARPGDSLARRLLDKLGDRPTVAVIGNVGERAATWRGELAAGGAMLIEPPGSVELERSSETEPWCDAVLAGLASQLLEPDRHADAVSLLQLARRLLHEQGLVVTLSEPVPPERGSTATDSVLIEGLLAETGLRPVPARQAARDEIWARPDPLHARRFAPGDEHHILELFATSFHAQRGLEHWSWKYARSPFGCHRISLIVDDEGTLVAQYCAYPVPFSRSGDGPDALAHQVGDTMTARSVRHIGRGPTSVLARAAKHFYARHCHRRVAFNYGFNTGNIQKFSMRFVGAHKIEDVAYRRRGLTAACPPQSTVLLELARRADRRFDQLWQNCRRHYGELIVRDARYLQWRYFDRPDLEYVVVAAHEHGSLVAWSVFGRRGSQLVWGDALFDREALGERLAATSEALLQRALGALQPTTGDDDSEALAEIVCWFPERPVWWHANLERLGFEMATEPQQLGLVVVPFEDTRAPERLRERLYYTYGDSDLF